jgi:hypothetical protein
VSEVTVERLGHWHWNARAIILWGGPYHIHVFVANPDWREYRFPAEPARDIYGRPSICAPSPTTDGPVRYRNTGQRNALGCQVFEHVEG